MLLGVFSSVECANRYWKVGDCTRTVDPKVRMCWKLESCQALGKAQMTFVYRGIKVGKRKSIAIRKDPI